MKICIKCNSQLPDMYVACPNCGETQLVMSQNNNYNQQPMMQQQYNYYMMQNQPVQKKKSNLFNTASIVFFVLGYFMQWWYGFISLLFALIALIQTLGQIHKSKEKSNNTQKAAIMISVTFIILNIVTLLFIFSRLNWI